MVSFANSSMGNYLGLVSFLLNCVQILKIGEYWEECCLCQLLNSKKNNGRDALWCSSMGNSPILVCFLCFLFNCVYTLHHNDQVNVASASSSIARKTMVEVLYVAPCSINGFFLAQLILYFLLLNVYHSPSNTQKLVVEILDVKTILCDNMAKKRIFMHCL